MDVVTLSGFGKKIRKRIRKDLRNPGKLIKRFANPLNAIRPFNGMPPKEAVTMLTDRLKGVNPASFGAHLIKNEIARIKGYGVMQPNRVGKTKAGANGYREYLVRQSERYKGTGVIPKLITRELALIDAGKFTGQMATPVSGIGKRKKGRFFKKLGKGLKKALKFNKMLALAPSRNAALALIGLNFRGLAFKMQRAPVDKLKKKWERLGGNPKKLFNTIKKGAKRKPLLGSKIKKLKKGVGYAELIQGIGVEPATTGTAAMLALAAPIVAGLIALVAKKRGEKAGKDPDTGEVLETTASGEKMSSLEALVEQAKEVAASAGIPTELPSGNYKVEDVEAGASEDAGLPTGDDEIDNGRLIPPSESKFELSPMLLLGAAGAAFLLLKKK